MRKKGTKKTVSRMVQPDLEDGVRPRQKTVHSSEEFFEWVARQSAGELDIMSMERLDGHGTGLYVLSLRWKDNPTPSAPEFVKNEVQRSPWAVPGIPPVRSPQEAPEVWEW